MKNKFLSLTLGSLLLATSLGSYALTVEIEDEKCGKLTEGFSYVFDYSGSMNKTLLEDKELQQELDKKAGKEVKEIKRDPNDETTKVKLAKEVFLKINERLPELSLNASLMSFAPFVVDLKEGPWDRDKMADKIKKHKENMETFGRLTNLGVGFAEFGASLGDKVLPPNVMLIATDGVSRRGADPVEALTQLYAKQPNLCVWFLSLAELEEGKNNLNKLQALRSSCSRIVNAKDLLNNDAVLDDLIAKAFYTKCTMTLEIRGINFAFDRYNIDEKSEKILTEALTYINTLPPQQQIEVNGWTDWVGSDAYNAVLSQNRANAVKDWFIAHGIEASRLTAIGRGKSFKYNNRTSYGRYLNRHMELRFIPLDD